MSDYIYGKGGKNKGKKRVTCISCRTHRYINKFSFEKAQESLFVICGDCKEFGKTPAPTEPAHTVYTLIQLSDDWRPAWYGVRFTVVDETTQFMIVSVGWENMTASDRAKSILNAATGSNKRLE